MEATHNQNLNGFPGSVVVHPLYINNLSTILYQAQTTFYMSCNALSHGYKKAIKWCETMGTFHTTKTLKQKQMVWTSFFANVSRNCWISEKTIQLKISEILGGKSNGMEIPSKKFLESLYTTQVVWLSRNSGKCCSIYYWKLHGKHTIFQWIESAHNFCVIYIIL